MQSLASETRPVQSPRVTEDMETDPGPVVLIGPDNLLAEGVVHPHATDGDHEGEGSSTSTGSSGIESPLSWYKRPSPRWMLFSIFIGALSMGSVMAPRLEILNRLVCHELRPEYIILEPPIPSDGWWPTQPTFPPGGSKGCMTDPDVQAAVALLLVATTLTTGIISCFVGAWWGQFSDRYGRKPVLVIFFLRSALMDISMLLLSCATDVLPGGYRFLFVPAVLDGLMGGVSAASAVSYAYIADCVPPAALSRYLAFGLGLLYTGITLGPTLGVFLISATGDLLSVYYISTVKQITFIIIITFILPESLPAATRANNVEKQRHEGEQEQRKRSEEIEEERHGNGMSGMERRSRQMSRFFKDIFFFLRPLALFIPSRDGKDGRDWNLTRIAICYACYGIIIGSYMSKTLYAVLAFGWSSKELAYYISLLSLARAAFLVAVLPALLKFFAPKPAPAIALPVAPNEPLQSDSNNPPGESAATYDIRSQTARHRTTSSDLKLAQISLVVEIISYVVVAAVVEPMWWVAATIFTALGGGFVPALKSLAVELHTADKSTNETGRLFGALGVLQAFCSQIVGPSIFGFTFMMTAQTFPRAIFVLGAAVHTVSFTTVSLIRLPLPATPDAEQATSSSDDESS